MRAVSPQARMAAANARRMQAMPAPTAAVPGMKKGGSCYAKGGVARADGCVSKGHTKGKMR